MFTYINTYGYPVALYFLSWVILGKYVFLTLFLAVIMEAFESKYDAQTTVELRRRAARHRKETRRVKAMLKRERATTLKRGMNTARGLNRAAHFDVAREQPHPTRSHHLRREGVDAISSEPNEFEHATPHWIKSTKLTMTTASTSVSRASRRTVMPFGDNTDPYPSGNKKDLDNTDWMSHPTTSIPIPSSPTRQTGSPPSFPNLTPTQVGVREGEGAAVVPLTRTSVSPRRVGWSLRRRGSDSLPGVIQAVTTDRMDDAESSIDRRNEHNYHVEDRGTTDPAGLEWSSIPPSGSTLYSLSTTNSKSNSNAVGLTGPVTTMRRSSFTGSLSGSSGWGGSEMDDLSDMVSDGWGSDAVSCISSDYHHPHLDHHGAHQSLPLAVVSPEPQISVDGGTNPSLSLATASLHHIHLLDPPQPSQTPPPIRHHPYRPRRARRRVPPHLIFQGRAFGCLDTSNVLRSWTYTVVISKWFDYAMFAMIGLSCITMAMERPGIPVDSAEAHFLYWSDVTFTVIFGWEVIAKMVAFTATQYIKQLTHQLDVVIVATSLILMGLEEVMGDELKVVRGLRVLRVVKPLRALTRSKGMLLILRSLALSLAAMGNVSLILVMFFVIFAILGVQLFMGQFKRCNDPTVALLSECIGNFMVDTTTDPPVEVARMVTDATFTLNNLGSALLSLFIVSSQDGYVPILDDAIAARGRGVNPVPDANPWVVLYFIAFTFTVAYCMLNMYVGVVFFQFSRINLLSQAGTAFLTREQSEWVELNKILSRMRPVEKPAVARGWGRRWVQRVVNHAWFDRVVMFVIILSVIEMAIHFYDEVHT